LDRFGSTANMQHQLSEWASANEAYADVAAMLVDTDEDTIRLAEIRTVNLFQGMSVDRHRKNPLVRFD
jgi:hypothetical protein